MPIDLAAWAANPFGLQPNFVEATPPPPEATPAPVPVFSGSGVGNCPEGFFYNPNTGNCESTGVTPPPQTTPPVRGPTVTGRFPILGGGSSLTGTFTNPFMPVSGGTSTTGVTQTGDVGSEGPIYVNVANTTTVADASASDAINNVASAVSGAINSTNAYTGSLLGDFSNTISSNIGNLVGSLDSGITGAQQDIADVISRLGSAVSGSLNGIVSTVGNSIFNAVNPVTSALGAIVQVISGQIGGLAGAIGNAVGAIIPAIVGAVTGAVAPGQAALQAISAEIGNNLNSLVLLPGAIADAETSLAGTLGKLLSGYETFVQSTTGYGTGETQHKDLDSIAKAIAGLVTTVSAGAAPKLADLIASTCQGVDLDKALNLPWIPTNEEVIAGTGEYHILFNLWARLIQYVFSVLPVVQKITEVARQRIDADCPTALLAPAQLVDAVQRGILPLGNALQEAARGDLTEARFNTLQDLFTHQFSPAELTEAVYRGIISDSDFFQALNQQALTGPQQLIQKALGAALLSPDVLTTLYRRGFIDISAFNAGLAANRLNPDQQKVLGAAVYRPPLAEEALEGVATDDAMASLGVQQAFNLSSVPEYFQQAAAHEGLDIDTTNLRWSSHWQLGGISTWLTLYYRGQTTLANLQAVLRREFIPDPLHVAIIEANRPIVQFRTISTALQQKIITEAQARILLAQHGYSSENIDILVAYAERPSKAAAAKNAAAQRVASLAIAKEEYRDGSIDAGQYAAILTQHGFTSDGANAEIQVENAAAAMAERKLNAQLVVDEYGAGLINEQQALAQLASQGLTVYELARYSHKIRVFRVAKAKTPTEAELNHFLQLSIITQDQYVASLEQQGYSSMWAQSFLAWRVKPVVTATAATPATSAPTGGTTNGATSSPVTT